MGSERFYQELPSFTAFAEVVEDRHYHAVPKDWTVIITDVRGSTRAIEEGRYRDVNTIGAATISCLQNSVADLELPYVFGGDGATLVVPNSRVEQICRELMGLQALAREKFGLKLRVGAVPVTDLSSDVRLEVAKFKLIHQKCIALFRGGGVAEAEELVKGAPEKYKVQSADVGVASLQGLSCRWQPIPSRNGKILSILVVTKKEDNKVYREVVDTVEALYDGGIEEGNPVHIDLMQYKSIRQLFVEEHRLHRSIWHWRYWLRMLEIIGAILIFRVGLPGVHFNAWKYRRELAAHSDYRKFDDTLRMIIDCNASQARAIRDSLDELYRKGEILFGVHESDNSLMTCVVEHTWPGQHIHFIDGGDGGYAMAAKQLKEQAKMSSNTGQFSASLLDETVDTPPPPPESA